MRCWLTVGLSAVPLALVVAEPDLGVVMLMLALLIGLIALSGVRLRWLGLMIAGGAARHHGRDQAAPAEGLPGQPADLVPEPVGRSARHRLQRAQSKIAIGSGGWTGQGLFHGQLVAGNFVPEQHTDFIFAVAGEEIGFVG